MLITKWDLFNYAKFPIKQVKILENVLRYYIDVIKVIALWFLIYPEEPTHINNRLALYKKELKPLKWKKRPVTI